MLNAPDADEALLDVIADSVSPETGLDRENSINPSLNISVPEVAKPKESVCAGAIGMDVNVD